VYSASIREAYFCAIGRRLSFIVGVNSSESAASLRRDREVLDLLDACQPCVGAVNTGLHSPAFGIRRVRSGDRGIQDDQRDVVRSPVTDCAA